MARSGLLLSVLLVLTLCASSAQTTALRTSSSARIYGKVLDPDRNPIAGARITALADGRDSGPSAISGEAGEFSLALDPGNYTLNVVAEGFQTASQTVNLSPAGFESREFLLPIAEIHETVNVNESAGYQVAAISSGTRTLTPLRDVPNPSRL
jgi:hypothetical protein